MTHHRLATLLTGISLALAASFAAPGGADRSCLAVGSSIAGRAERSAIARELADASERAGTIYRQIARQRGSDLDTCFPD